MLAVAFAACADQPLEPAHRLRPSLDHEVRPTPVPCCTNFAIVSGPSAGAYPAGEFAWTVPLASNFPDGLTGRTVFGGTGCIADLNGNGVSDRAEVPPAATSGATIVVFARGTCFFSEKVESAQLAGYNAVLIGNSHAGSGFGEQPDLHICGSQGHAFTITASAVAIGHRALHLIFGDAPEYVGADVGPGNDLPAIGTLGEVVSASPDTEGPTISNVSATPSSLWPPNRDMVDVTVAYTLADDCAVVSAALSVTSSDPVTGPGDVTSPDWEVVDGHHVRLRAERRGSESRTYSIWITATDQHGNQSTASVEVLVPHSRRP